MYRTPELGHLLNRARDEQDRIVKVFPKVFPPAHRNQPTEGADVAKRIRGAPAASPVSLTTLAVKVPRTATDQQSRLHALRSATGHAGPLAMGAHGFGCKASIGITQFSVVRVCEGAWL